MTNGDQPVSWLMFFAFAAVIFIIAGACIAFLQRRSNRAAASQALVGTDSTNNPTAAPEGALPELLAVVLFAFIAMGLLTAGYMSKSRAEKAPSMPPVGASMPMPAK